MSGVQPNGERVPIGVLTDRDIVVEVIAACISAAALTVTRRLSPMLDPSHQAADDANFELGRSIRNAPNTTLEITFNICLKPLL